MITKAQIDEFYSQKHIAIIGVSRDKKKFGNMVFTELKKNGYKVVPVNTNADTIEDSVCYRSIDALPSEISAAVLLTNKKDALSNVQKLAQKGIRQIWLQQKTDTPEAIDFAIKNNVNLIYGKCIFMFSQPAAGLHKFHGSMVKFFGGWPK